MTAFNIDLKRLMSCSSDGKTVTLIDDDGHEARLSLADLMNAARMREALTDNMGDPTMEQPDERPFSDVLRHLASLMAEKKWLTHMAKPSSTTAAGWARLLNAKADQIDAALATHPPAATGAADPARVVAERLVEQIQVDVIMGDRVEEYSFMGCACTLDVATARRAAEVDRVAAEIAAQYAGLTADRDRLRSLLDSCLSFVVAQPDDRSLNSILAKQLEPLLREALRSTPAPGRVEGVDLNDIVAKLPRDMNGEIIHDGDVLYFGSIKCEARLTPFSSGEGGDAYNWTQYSHVKPAAAAKGGTDG